MTKLLTLTQTTATFLICALLNACVLFAFMPNVAFGKVSEEEAKRLGKDLTPMGAERAGNKAGTIPPYTGEIVGAPKWVDYKGTGHHYPDPYANDRPLFHIHSRNYKKFRRQLSVGTNRLFELYPKSFSMPVYQSRRDTSYDDFTHKNVYQNALTATLANGGDGIVDGFGGPAFPIPQNAKQVIWNHISHSIWWSFSATYSVAAIYNNGEKAFQRYQDFARLPYLDRSMKRGDFDNLGGSFIRQILEPTRDKGFLILVHEYLDQVKEPRAAWTYVPGSRRVRRAPTVGHDNPSGTGGLRTDDDRQGFNGSIERYDWELVGKREMYIPYNNYKFDDPKVSYDKILTPFHVPPELMRYELHRVWIIEAFLKEGKKHIYKKRRFYIDEDSWLIVSVDLYDQEDNLFRMMQLLSVNAFDMPGITGRAELQYDFKNKAYVADKLQNEEKTVLEVFSKPKSFKFFTPSNLRKLGIR